MLNPAAKAFRREGLTTQRVLAVAGALAIGALSVVGAALVAHAQDVAIQANYTTAAGVCTGEPQTLVTIAERNVTGPGFVCTLLGDGIPAGTGFVAYPANCVVDGMKLSDNLAMDLGNFADHFELFVPGRTDWLPIYPCTAPGAK